MLRRWTSQPRSTPERAPAGRELDVNVGGHEATVRQLAGGREREAMATLSWEGRESVVVAIDGLRVGCVAGDDASELEPLVREQPLVVAALLTASQTAAAVTLLDVPAGGGKPRQR
jgi:hypothetical protein